MVSLKERVHTWRSQHPDSTKSDLYIDPEFKDENKNSLRTYYNSYDPFSSDISNNITLINIDTIKEMEIAIQQIKDPVKRCENLSRLHQMKLKPIVNKKEKSLKELFDAT